MKPLKFKSNLWIVLVVMGLSFNACSDEDTSVEIENTIEEQDVDLVARSSEVDDIEVNLGDLVIQIYENDISNNTAGRISQRPNLPDCVTITVVAEQNFREVTLDFGSEGCMIRGRMFRGQIVISYDRDPEAREVLISYNLIDFFYNERNVIGSKTILRERSNENENPQFTHSLDLTVIWPDGAEASRTGVKVREWVEGFGSGIFSDNVFEITGNWTTVFRNGNTRSYEVLTPLRREVICRFFVSGSVDVQRPNFGGVLDYGDGDCDNEALFTFNNGEEREITLN